MTPRCAINLMVRALSFLERLVCWIECITDPFFLVSMNRSLVGYLSSDRGVRRGDPLSPCLFVVAMECLSNLLDSIALEGLIGYYLRYKKFKTTPLFLAYDLFIFLMVLPSLSKQSMMEP